MEGHLERWRRRLALHAAMIFLLFGLLIAFRFMVELDGGATEADVHRWRMAHLEGLTRSFVLFGLAGCLPVFRLTRSIVTFSSSLIIAATWAAVIGAVLTALWGQNGRGGWTPALPPDELLLHRIVMVTATFATIGTIAAMLLVFTRSVWEALREGWFPRSWHNWARIVAIRPRKVAEPSSCSELESILQKAFDSNTPVRAFGSRASWNPIATSHGVMIRMEKLDRILAFEPDANPATVQVEAGIEIGALSEYLHANGYTLASTPVIPWVQVGGALATCSHGTGIHHDQFSDLVCKMQIFQDDSGTARLEPYTRNHPDWNGLLTGLGALGVVYSVTFDIVPDFNVHFRDIPMPMRYTIDFKLRDLLYREVDTNTVKPGIYSEILWFPYNHDCIVKQWFETGEPAPPSGWFDLLVDFLQFLQTRLLTPALHFVLSLFPSLTPPVMRFIHDVSYKEDRVMPLYRGMQYLKRYPRVVAMSRGIPFDPADEEHGLDGVRKAWYAAVDRLDALEHDAIYPLNMVLHARFVKNGTALLNPAWADPSKDPGFTCHIEVLTAENTPRYEEFFKDLEQQWELMCGRPHWGKLSFWPERIRDTIPPNNLATWANLRLRVDPRALFMNDYLREILRLKE